MEVVVNNRDGERLAVLSCIKNQCAGLGSVIIIRCSRAITRGVVDGDATGGSRRSLDGNRRCGFGLADAVGGCAELHAARRVVVDDIQCCRAWRAKDSPTGGIGKVKIDGLVLLIEGVVNDGDGKGLAGLSCLESQRAGRGFRGFVVFAGCSRAITRGVVDGDATGGSGRSLDGNRRCGFGLADAVSGRAELHGARRVVVDDIQCCRAWRAKDSPTGGIGKVKIDGLVLLIEGVVNDGDGKGLAGLSCLESQRAGHGFQFCSLCPL